tara:strand:- start:1072 stop:1638 length:567 start_codon:yes stop_codon:yes gene_type:complete
MNKQSIILYKLNHLFEALLEVKEILNSDIYKVVSKNELLTINSNQYGNYIIVTEDSNLIIKNNFFINNFPIKLKYFIEKINIQLLRQKYNFQSEIIIKKYKLDLNSREIINNKKKVKLTQKELEILLFLKENQEPQKIETLQKEVWGHNIKLETHTVETHIYRLRKKIKDIFQDDNMIQSVEKGYILK